MTLSCNCGQVQLTVDRRPDYINACNCTLCRKAGARWGYYAPADVRVDGATKGYRRADRADPNTELQFCPECGSTTHFVLTEGAASRFGNTLVGVNMGLADERELSGVEVRYPDGQAWSGVGGFGYVRAPRIIG